MNSSSLRNLVFAAASFLLLVNVIKSGLLAGFLPLLAPLVWLWFFVLRHQIASAATVPSQTTLLSPVVSRVEYGAVALAFCCAWLLAPVFVFLGEALNGLFAGISQGFPLTYYVLRAGLIEELLKFSAVLVVLKYLWPGAIRHPADGIVLAIAASLGFAAYENIYHNEYLFSLEDGVLKTYLLGALIRVPLHALYGAVWGAALGLSRFVPASARGYLIGGLSVSIFLHGLWDTMAQSNSALVFALLMLFFAGLWYSYLRIWQRINAVQFVSKEDLGQ